MIVVSTDEKGPEGEKTIRSDFAAISVDDDDSEIDDDEVEFLFEWHTCAINPMPIASENFGTFSCNGSRLLFALHCRIGPDPMDCNDECKRLKE